MKLQLSRMIDTLVTLYPLDIISSRHRTNAEISSIRVLTEQTADLRSDVLYVCDSSVLQAINPGRLVLNILCRGEIASSVQPVWANCNLFRVRDPVSAADLMNAVLSITLEPSGNNFEPEFVEELLASNDPFLFSDLVYRDMGHPVLVIDTDYKVLAYTRGFSSDDPHWNKVIKAHMLDLDTVAGAEWRKALNDIMKRQRAEFCFYRGQRMIVKPLCADGTVLGHLCVMEYYNSFEKNDLGKVDLLGALLISCLNTRRGPYSGIRTQSELFLTFLLEGNPFPSSRIPMKLESLGWRLRKYLYVAAVRGFELKAEHYPSYRDVLEALPPEYRRCAVYFNFDVVVLVSADKPVSDIRDEFETLLSPVNKLGMDAGFSRAFYSLSDLRSCYLQAVEALNFGIVFNRDTHLHNYEDYVLYHVLDVYGRDADVRALCNPGILSLRESDRKNRTDYLKTFRHYILHGRSLRRTAEAMFIHRNTVSYRIGKCLEALNMDPDNGDHLFQILLSLKIADYLETER